MKKTICLVLSFVLALSLFGAFAEGADALVGTWQALSMKMYGMTFDFTDPSLNAAIEFTFRADGSFECVTTSGEDENVQSGTYSVSGATVLLIVDGEESYETFSLEDGTLTIEETDADGNVITMVFVKAEGGEKPHSGEAAALEASELLGVWYVTKAEYDGETQQLPEGAVMTFEFTEDTLTLSASYQGETMSESADYFLSGNTITTLYGSELDEGTVFIVDGILAIEMGGMTYYAER